jgi:uncharacterized membrane protein YheB (UPF0754 family)
MDFDLQTLIDILPYALPPLIGAVIGYITNAVAIKMLFRPLYEKRIGSMRVPLTPGIIPRQRGELAQSLGRMVSRELITEDAVRRQVAAPTFRNTVRERISSLTETVLYTPVEELPQKFGRRLPEAAQQPPAAADAEGAAGERQKGDRQAVETLINDLLISFVRGAPFGHGLRYTIDFGMRGIAKKQLSTLIGEKGERLDEIAGTKLLEKVQPAVRKAIQDSLVRGIRNNVHLSSVFTEQVIDGICRFIERLYPDMLESVVAYLNDPTVRRQLEKRGRSFLREVIEKLNNFQRFVVIAGQYDRTLNEQMHVIVDDALRQFDRAGREDENREKLIEVLRERLHRFSQTSLGELAAYWGDDFIDDVGHAVDLLFDWLTNERGGQRVKRAIENLAKHYGASTVDEAVRQITGEPVAHYAPAVSEWVTSVVQSQSAASGAGQSAAASADAPETGGEPEAPQPQENFFSTFVRVVSDEGRLSAAEIFDMDPSEKEKLDGRLFELLMTVLDEQIPSILESVDVKSLVVDKIESLDMEQVEELLLEVIRTHLRWIVIFGAFLGFLIGAVQVGVIYFTG